MHYASSDAVSGDEGWAKSSENLLIKNNSTSTVALKNYMFKIHSNRTKFVSTGCRKTLVSYKSIDFSSL